MGFDTIEISLENIYFSVTVGKYIFYKHYNREGGGDKHFYNEGRTNIYKSIYIKRYVS